MAFERARARHTHDDLDLRDGGLGAVAGRLRAAASTAARDDCADEREQNGERCEGVDRPCVEASYSVHTFPYVVLG